MELKDVLHFYIGCEVMTDQNKVGRLSSVDICEVDYSIVMLTVRYSDSIDDWDVFNDNEEMERVKLILLPVKTMNEIQKQELRKVACLEPEDLDILNGGTAHLTTLKDWVNACNFLRREHFDIDGLIESGQAINKTKLNP